LSALGAAAHSACATTTPAYGDGFSGASSFGRGASGATCGPADSLATSAGGAGGSGIGLGARRSFSAFSTLLMRSYTHSRTSTHACTCSSTLAASAPFSAQEVSLMRRNWRWSMPMRGHGRVW